MSFKSFLKGHLPSEAHTDRPSKIAIFPVPILTLWITFSTASFPLYVAPCNRTLSLFTMLIAHSLSLPTRIHAPQGQQAFCFYFNDVSQMQNTVSYIWHTTVSVEWMFNVKHLPILETASLLMWPQAKCCFVAATAQHLLTLTSVLLVFFSQVLLSPSHCLPQVYSSFQKTMIFDLLVLFSNQI